jgi:predicted metal-binding membrane protein
MKRGRDAVAPLLFTAGYLATWSVAGVVAYAVFRLGRDLLGDQLMWHEGGRWLAGGVLLVAAVYELTPLKDLCLSKCRSPLGYLIGSWRDGRVGALRMGAGHGGWCLGCCWALMAALFALGVMSLAWTAIVAGIIAIEKTLPYKRAATWGAAALLVLLAIGVLAFPESVPGLTVPGGMG